MGTQARVYVKATWVRKHDPNTAYRRSLSKERHLAYKEALDGGQDTHALTAEIPGGGTISRPAGGCAGVAQQRLYGDLGTWFRADKIAANLRPLYVPPAPAKPRSRPSAKPGKPTTSPS